VSQVVRLHARQILDSRGFPTLEVEATLGCGAVGRASVPTGASTGRLESAELRDGGEAWSAKGVSCAAAAVEGEIDAAVRGLEGADQARIDETLIALDGTPHKARLGANAILGTSLAVARAAAAERGLPLWRHLGGQGAVVMPVPLMNVLNGGLHAANRLDFEEFMVVPVGPPTFVDALRVGVEVFHELRATLLAHGRRVGVGDEGGFAPDLGSNERAFELLQEAISAAGYEPGVDVWLGLDAAAGELRADGGYTLGSEGRAMSTEELASYYRDLRDRYPLLVLEDGMADDDRGGWLELTRSLDERLELIGDDIFATSSELLREGIAAGIANAVLVRPNQVGTLTETLRTIQLARDHGYVPVMSHRSGETEDTTICDLAVAARCPQIKAGAPARERALKYNRLLRIEEALGEAAIFAGTSAFPGLI
jgi:enolase